MALDGVWGSVLSECMQFGGCRKQQGSCMGKNEFIIHSFKNEYFWKSEVGSLTLYSTTFPNSPNITEFFWK